MESSATTFVNNTPRILGAQALNFDSRNVILVGTVSADAANHQIVTCDNIRLYLNLTASLQIQPGKIEVHGQLSQKGTSITATKLIPLGVNFNLDLYTKALTLKAKFPGVF